MVTPVVRTVLYSNAYAPETRAYFNRLTGPKLPAWRRLADNYIRGLTRNGLWPTLDAIHLIGSGDGQAGNQNVIANQYNLTPVNSPTFTPYRGYTGDGVAAYLDTGAATNALAKYSLNSACAFFWQLNNVQSNGHTMSDPSGLGLILIARNTSNKFYMRMEDVTAALPASTDSTGLWCGNRSSSTARQLYRNGASFYSDSQASVSSPGTIRFLGTTGAFSTAQIALGGYGASLNATQHATFYALSNAYVTGIQALS